MEIVWRCSMTRAFLKNSPNPQENLSVGVSFFVFSCEFGEIVKSTFFNRAPPGYKLQTPLITLQVA